jgi:hypothetical protein
MRSGWLSLIDRWNKRPSDWYPQPNAEGDLGPFGPGAGIDVP